MADAELSEQLRDMPMQAVVGPQESGAAPAPLPMEARVASLTPGPAPEDRPGMWQRFGRNFRDQVEMARAQKRDAHNKAETAYYENVSTKLQEAMLEDDPTIRQTAIDSILSSVEKQQKKPISKEFRKWLSSSPEDALRVLDAQKQQGADPRTIFNAANNPMLFAHGLLAMGRAKRELAARQARGDGGALPSVAPSASPAPVAAPQPQLPTAADNPDVMGDPAIVGNQAPQPAPAPVVATAPAAAAPAPTGRQLRPELAAVAESLTGRAAALSKRINTLASMGRPEAEIAPLRAERADLNKQLNEIQIKAPEAADVADATTGVQPVPQAELSAAVEAAVRAKRPDLAARFVPGMRRNAYDAVVGQLTGPTQTNPTGSAPTATNASPYSLVPQSAPNPARLNANAVPQSAAPINLIQTPSESETEKGDIARRTQKLPEDLLRDPSVVKSGITTQGQLEDAIKSGAVTLTDANEKARRTAVATHMGEAAVKDFGAIKETGNTARRLGRYYDVLAGAASNAGPRGPWLTPMREVVNNFANVMAIKDPSGQSNLQLMNAISMKLVPELTKEFKGSQSDREFMAGVASAPSTYNSEKGFAVLLHVGREMNKINLEQDLQARKWVTKYGDLSSVDSKGRDFQSAFDETLQKFNDEHGDLQTRVAKAMKLKPNELLRAR